MATELAKAFVQIVPSARGIQGSIASALGGEPAAAGATAGQSLGSRMIGTLKGIIATAGIGKALSAAISEGAALEQSIGGIETLFGDSADKVKQYAAEAYRTAGLSANEYMELATSFSASLLQSLSGDTSQAADIADMAMQDMADNSNKMGTSIEMIQNAYRGFARGNYTMLDNLSLGYGGTRQEMERLLAHAQELTGIEYDIDNLSDVYSAIHEIQGELGITGATAAEAEGTISGSLASLKAAFKNVLGQLTLGQDIKPALQALAQTVSSFLVKNLLPAVWNILSALPGALAAFIQTAAPQMAAAFMEILPQLQARAATLLPQLAQLAQQMIGGLCAGLAGTLPQLAAAALGVLQSFVGAVLEGFPLFLSAGQQVLQALIEGVQGAVPQLLATVLEILNSLVTAFLENLPLLLSTGQQLLQSLIGGIQATLPQVLAAAGEAIITMVQGLIQNFPQIIASGIELITNLVRGIGNALPDIGAAAGRVARRLWDTIKQTDWLQLGADIIRGLIKGIGSMAGALWDAAVNIARSALNAIKSFFGIASPSRVMRDEVGRYIPLGLAAGIEANTRPVSQAMQELSRLTAGTLQADLQVGLRSGPLAGAPVLAGAAGGTTNNFYQTINSHEALSPAELTREAEDLFARRRWKNP